jgi:hypothetical protein
MTYRCRSYSLAAAGTILWLLGAMLCPAQTVRANGHQDHSCTVYVAGSFANPKGLDGKNFENGWGIRAGLGVALWQTKEPHGWSVFLTTGYNYDKFRATAKALGATNVSGATSAHGGFSAVTLDPEFRYAANRQLNFYGSGGFGWFRRTVDFQGTDLGTLTQPDVGSFGRVASNSGVYDIGGGVNVGMNRSGGLMVFVEGRVYHGAAINSSSTLVPVSAGIRW